MSPRRSEGVVSDGSTVTVLTCLVITTNIDLTHDTALSSFCRVSMGKSMLIRNKKGQAGFRVKMLSLQEFQLCDSQLLILPSSLKLRQIYFLCDS